MWQLLTSAIVMLAPALVLIYDLVAGHLGGHDATITAVIQWWTRSVPELPFLFAALMVWLWLHLFFTPIVERVNRVAPPVPPAAVKDGV